LNKTTSVESSILFYGLYKGKSFKLDFFLVLVYLVFFGWILLKVIYEYISGFESFSLDVFAAELGMELYKAGFFLKIK
jgi:hypothetical protein